MPPHENSHDKLFKSALADPKDVAMQLRAVLPPALAGQLDFSTLKPLPGTFVDESMRGSQADLLFAVRRADEELWLYVLMEHKSEVDRWTLLQLLRYMLRIWERNLAEKTPPSTLSPIIPVIVHHSETGWTAPTHFQGLFNATAMADAELRRLTPEFQVELDDLSHRSDQDIRARAMGPVATLDLLFLRDGRREGRILEELVAWADLFRAVLVLPDGQRAIVRLFSYLSRVAPNLNLKELTERVRRTIPETESVVMTLAEQLLEQGEKRGIEKGIEKGYRAVVRRQIELKFGELDSITLARLEAADERTLERYIERVLTASSVGEMLGE
jgi:predicted transposase YdaD